MADSYLAGGLLPHGCMARRTTRSFTGSGKCGSQHEARLSTADENVRIPRSSACSLLLSCTPLRPFKKRDVALQLPTSQGCSRSSLFLPGRVEPASYSGSTFWGASLSTLYPGLRFKAPQTTIRHDVVTSATMGGSMWQYPPSYVPPSQNGPTNQQAPPSSNNNASSYPPYSHPPPPGHMQQPGGQMGGPWPPPSAYGAYPPPYVYMNPNPYAPSYYPNTYNIPYPPPPYENPSPQTPPGPAPSSNGISGFDNVGVFWDIENCQVPWNEECAQVVRRIRDMAQQYGYVRTIRAYGKPEVVITRMGELLSCGVEVIPVAPGKEMADKSILTDALLFALDCIDKQNEGSSRKGCIVIISGDAGFGAVLTKLSSRGVRTVVVARRRANGPTGKKGFVPSALSQSADVFLDWQEFLGVTSAEDGRPPPVAPAPRPRSPRRQPKSPKSPWTVSQPFPEDEAMAEGGRWTEGEIDERRKHVVDGRIREEVQLMTSHLGDQIAMLEERLRIAEGKAREETRRANERAQGSGARGTANTKADLMWAVERESPATGGRRSVDYSEGKGRDDFQTGNAGHEENLGSSNTPPKLTRHLMKLANLLRFVLAANGPTKLMVLSTVFERLTGRQLKLSEYSLSDMRELVQCFEGVVCVSVGWLQRKDLKNLSQKERDDMGRNRRVMLAKTEWNLRLVGLIQSGLRRIVFGILKDWPSGIGLQFFTTELEMRTNEGLGEILVRHGYGRNRLTTLSRKSRLMILLSDMPDIVQIKWVNHEAMLYLASGAEAEPRISSWAEEAHSGWDGAMYDWGEEAQEVGESKGGEDLEDSWERDGEYSSEIEERRGSRDDRNARREQKWLEEEKDAKGGERSSVVSRSARGEDDMTENEEEGRTSNAGTTRLHSAKRGEVRSTADEGDEEPDEEMHGPQAGKDKGRRIGEVDDDDGEEEEDEEEEDDDEEDEEEEDEEEEEEEDEELEDGAEEDDDDDDEEEEEEEEEEDDEDEDMEEIDGDEQGEIEAEDVREESEEAEEEDEEEDEGDEEGQMERQIGGEVKQLDRRVEIELEEQVEGDDEDDDGEGEEDIGAEEDWVTVSRMAQPLLSEGESDWVDLEESDEEDWSLPHYSSAVVGVDAEENLAFDDSLTPRRSTSHSLSVPSYDMELALYEAQSPHRRMRVQNEVRAVLCSPAFERAKRSVTAFPEVYEERFRRPVSSLGFSSMERLCRAMPHVVHEGLLRQEGKLFLTSSQKNRRIVAGATTGLRRIVYQVLERNPQGLLVDELVSLCSFCAGRSLSSVLLDLGYMKRGVRLMVTDMSDIAMAQVGEDGVERYFLVEGAEDPALTDGLLLPQVPLLPPLHEIREKQKRQEGGDSLLVTGRGELLENYDEATADGGTVETLAQEVVGREEQETEGEDVMYSISLQVRARLRLILASVNSGRGVKVSAVAEVYKDRFGELLDLKGVGAACVEDLASLWPDLLMVVSSRTHHWLQLVDNHLNFRATSLASLGVPLAAYNVLQEAGGKSLTPFMFMRQLDKALKNGLWQVLTKLKYKVPSEMNVCVPQNGEGARKEDSCGGLVQTDEDSFDLADFPGLRMMLQDMREVVRCGCDERGSLVLKFREGARPPLDVSKWSFEILSKGRYASDKAGNGAGRKEEEGEGGVGEKEQQRLAVVQFKHEVCLILGSAQYAVSGVPVAKFRKVYKKRTGKALDMKQFGFPSGIGVEGLFKRLGQLVDMEALQVGSLQLAPRRQNLRRVAVAHSNLRTFLWATLQVSPQGVWADLLEGYYLDCTGRYLAAALAALGYRSGRSQPSVAQHTIQTFLDEMGDLAQPCSFDFQLYRPQAEALHPRLLDAQLLGVPPQRLEGPQGQAVWDTWHVRRAGEKPNLQPREGGQVEDDVGVDVLDRALQGLVGIATVDEQGGNTEKIVERSSSGVRGAEGAEGESRHLEGEESMGNQGGEPTMESNEGGIDKEDREGESSENRLSNGIADSGVVKELDSLVSDGESIKMEIQEIAGVDMVREENIKDNREALIEGMEEGTVKTGEPREEETVVVANDVETGGEVLREGEVEREKLIVNDSLKSGPLVAGNELSQGSGAALQQSEEISIGDMKLSVGISIQSCQETEPRFEESVRSVEENSFVKGTPSVSDAQQNPEDEEGKKIGVMGKTKIGDECADHEIEGEERFQEATQEVIAASMNGELTVVEDCGESLMALYGDAPEPSRNAEETENMNDAQVQTAVEDNAGLSVASKTVTESEASEAVDEVSEGERRESDKEEESCESGSHKDTTTSETENVVIQTPPLGREEEEFEDATSSFRETTEVLEDEEEEHMWQVATEEWWDEEVDRGEGSSGRGTEGSTWSGKVNATTSEVDVADSSNLAESVMLRYREDSLQGIVENVEQEPSAELPSEPSTLEGESTVVCYGQEEKREEVEEKEIGGEGIRSNRLEMVADESKDPPKQGPNEPAEASELLEKSFEPSAAKAGSADDRGGEKPQAEGTWVSYGYEDLQKLQYEERRERESTEAVAKQTDDLPSSSESTSLSGDIARDSSRRGGGGGLEQQR